MWEEERWIRFRMTVFGGDLQSTILCELCMTSEINRQKFLRIEIGAKRLKFLEAVVL